MADEKDGREDGGEGKKKGRSFERGCVFAAPTTTRACVRVLQPGQIRTDGESSLGRIR
jgi:hypothetical protein